MAGASLTEEGGGHGVSKRLALVRAGMSARGIGCLVVFGQGVVGAYGSFTAFSGLFPGIKGQYLLVPVAGSPILACGTREEADIAQGYGPGGIEVILADEPRHLPSFVGTSASRLTHDAGRRAVGFTASGRVGPSWDDHAAIVAETGPLIDCVAMVEEVRAEPLPDDIDELRETVRILESGIDAVSGLAEPGMTEWEVSGIVESEMRTAGILTSLVFISAGPYVGQLPQPRLIGPDAVVTVMVEAASRQGYWAELGALFVGPEVHPDVRDRLQAWIDVGAGCEALVSAGSTCGQVATALVERLSTVSQVDASGLGHGVGIDEGPPVIRLGSEERLRSGTAIALHPSLADPDLSLRVSVANTLQITDEGAMPLSVTPHRLRELS